MPWDIDAIQFKGKYFSGINLVVKNETDSRNLRARRYAKSDVEADYALSIITLTMFSKAMACKIPLIGCCSVWFYFGFVDFVFPNG